MVIMLRYLDFIQSAGWKYTNSMKKFEYCNQIIVKPHSVNMNDRMNKYGKRGWEAYAVLQIQEDCIMVLYKREIHEQ